MCLQITQIPRIEIPESFANQRGRRGIKVPVENILRALMFLGLEFVPLLRPKDFDRGFEP